MAIVYSDEYAGAFNSVPRVRVAPSKQGRDQSLYWKYTQVGTGNNPDTIYTRKIPAGSRLLLPMCAFWSTGCPAGVVLDVGHAGYTTPDGTVVAASTTALLADVDIAADNLVFGGMNTGAGTPDDQRPAVLTFWFNSRDDVTLTVTAKTSALQADDVLEGFWTFIHP